MAAARGVKPPKFKADPELLKRLTDALRIGNYVDDACTYAGIARPTFYLWMKRGQDEMARIAAGEHPDPKESDYVEIVDAVEKARAEAVVRNMHVIQNAARDGTWQAAAWWLERTRPEKFGRRLATEVTGPQGGPVEVDVSITPDALAERIAALLGEDTDD